MDKILFTADLHWRLYPEGDACTVKLADHVARSGADAFVIAGDVADRDPEEFGHCLSLFSDFDGYKMVVPGNHDLWTENGSSSEKYSDTLPQIARSSGFHYLDKSPFCRAGTAFIGNIGWYDYSFRNTEIGLTLEDYRKKRVPGRCGWNDRHFIQWEYSDEQFTKRCLRRLRRHYRQVEGDADRVICVLHHLAFKDLLYPRTSFPLEFCRAYLGSESFGDLLLRCPKVKYVVCGHRHGKDAHSENGLRSYVVGGEYRKKQLIELDLKKNDHQYVEFSPPDAADPPGE